MISEPNTYGENCVEMMVGKEGAWNDIYNYNGGLLPQARDAATVDNKPGLCKTKVHVTIST